MRALATTAYGSIDTLKIIDIPTPEPAAGQVRVKVHFSAVNPADFKVVTGEIKFLHGRVFPMVVGYDVSGIVDALGEGVTTLAKGDEVFGFVPYGGATKLGTYAEFTVIAATMLAKKPAALSHALAAACATPALTALQSVRDLGRLKAGGRVLVVGAAGGVGSAAIGVIKKLGAESTAICSTSNVDFVKGLGAAEVIDRKKGDPIAAAKGPFDVVFDAAAAMSWSATSKLLGSGGTFVSTLPSAGLFLHIALSTFTSTRARFVIVKSKPEDLALVGRWIGEGMTIPVESTVPVREVPAAIKKMAAGEVRGRTVVDVINGF